MLLLILVVIAPLPYGGVMPSGALRIELLCFLTAAIAILANRNATPLPQPSLIILAAVAVVGGIQLLPLPPDLLLQLSPGSTEVYLETNSALQLFGQRPLHPRVSIAPGETVRASLLVLSYVFAFVAGALLTRRRWQRSVLMAVLLINCLAHIIVAAVLQTDGQGCTERSSIRITSLATWRSGWPFRLCCSGPRSPVRDVGRRRRIRGSA